MKLNLIGHKYGRLVVISAAEKVKSRTAWTCACECGQIKIITQESLRNGDTKSCGCLSLEVSKSKINQMCIQNTKYTPREYSARKVWWKGYSEMSFEDFIILSQMNCFYCNSPPSNCFNGASKQSSNYMKENGSFIYNGLDRKNNSLNHSKENCLPCCKYCNYSKRERSFDEFIDWIKKVYFNLNK